MANQPTFEINQMVRYGGVPFIIVERQPDSSSSDGWKYKLNFYEDKWITAQELEPNNNQPTPKFKVGDSVRVRHDRHDEGKVANISCDGQHITVWWPELRGVRIVSPEVLELVPEESAPKFKVGDHVRKNTWKERSWAEVTWVAVDGSHFKFKFHGKGIQNPEAQDPADFHLVGRNEPETSSFSSSDPGVSKTCFLDEFAGLPRLPVPDALLTRPIPHILKHLNQDTAMNPIKIKNRTEVNGIDVDNLTDGQIVALISESEKQIETLMKLDHKPKRIEKLIAELESGITQLVDVLDKREEK